ncbi:MAG: hypothetical protein H6P96_1429, partial [Candidatus Aminicenantes bacterium]|nr:hypothetical protein [Candidatus Aminicenantes bacterium]
MERRRFIHLAGIASAGTIIPAAAGRPLLRPSVTAPFAGAAKLTAKDVAAHLRSIVPVDEPSVDRIVIGDPGTEISGIGTCWLPYGDTCRQAVSDGVNLLVVH